VGSNGRHVQLISYDVSRYDESSVGKKLGPRWHLTQTPLWTVGLGHEGTFTQLQMLTTVHMKKWLGNPTETLSTHTVEKKNIWSIHSLRLETAILPVDIGVLPQQN